MNASYPAATGPIRPALSGEARQIVLLLHGLGADGHDLIGLQHEWAHLLPDAVFISPHAPFPCDMAPYGHQWFSLQQWDETFIHAGVEQAAALLNHWIDDWLAQYDLSEDRLLLAGFSQGCMMALHVALRRKQPVAGVLGYSGMLVSPARLEAEIQSRPPVLLVHGTADSVVPYTRLKEAQTVLEALDVPVQSLSCPGLAHGIDAEGLRVGGQFLQQCLASVSG